VSLSRALLSLTLVAALSTSAATQKLDKDGLSVEFLQPEAVIEGKDATLRFAIRAADGTPLAGVRPAAWIDAKGTVACRDKIQSFLGGTLRARPSVDLNTYYILTLNAEPSVAVIDPLLGFGGSKLLTAVTLQSPGIDWVMSPDQKRLFVAMPLVNRVAVIDTESWEVVKNIDVGTKPTRLVLNVGRASARLVGLKPDLRSLSLWVLSETSAAVIDPDSLAVVDSLHIGQGRHDIVFDDTRAYVSSSKGDDKLLVAADALAYSPLSKSVFALDTASGTAWKVEDRQYCRSGAHGAQDRQDCQSSTRIEAKPGITSLTFAPGGRWGFLTNPKENAVHVLDASTAKIVTTAEGVGASPDQIAFTDDFAYVRAAGSDQVKMIRLSSLATDPEVSLAQFPAGQLPPAAAKTESFAAAIVPAPEPKAVLVANPADRTVYYYMEGMAAPMGTFVAKGRSPKAVLVLDRSLKEAEPSVFSIRTRVPAAGTYDVAFFLNDPRVVHCFELTVAEDPNAPRKAVKRAVKIEPLLEPREIRAGEEVEFKFRLSDPGTKELYRGVRDVRALAFLAPGTWQKRIAAQPDGEGIYRVRLTVPESGIYYVFLESPSLELPINKGRPMIFEVLK
jgi:DNA-binding beta-propeller fold protein YncE